MSSSKNARRRKRNKSVGVGNSPVPKLDRDNEEYEGPSTMRVTLLEETKANVNRLYREVIDDIADKFHFHSRPDKGEVNSQPMVVFLGNHSSGKSTFINYLLGESELQTTGQAPMDDGFTLICHGKGRDEQLGPAIVNNSKLPYQSLQNIGDEFVERLKMKFLPHPLLKDVTLVDSPGMIGSSAAEGRGYDFLEAVRWFATRADYVLFFFDGEKPGTTEETLDVFTNCLGGMDHKLLIIMNKVDTFSRIGDFVRTYGTLCWNLAKVIPFKDMPFIYTTYIPHTRDGMKVRKSLKSGDKSKKSDDGDDIADSSEDIFPRWSLDDCEKARKDVIRKIYSAPSRHADNLITELKKHCQDLEIHARVVSRARNQIWWTQFKLRLGVFVFLALSAVVIWQLNVVFTGGEEFFDTDDPTISVLPAVAVISIVFFSLFIAIPFYIRRLTAAATSDLDQAFESEYVDELLAEKTIHLSNVWERRVKPTTDFAVSRFPLLSYPSLKSKELGKLREIQGEEVESMLDRVHQEISSRSSR